jgi:hypothetical protein
MMSLALFSLGCTFTSTIGDTTLSIMAFSITILSIMRFSITTLSIMTFSVTTQHNIQHNGKLNATLIIMTLSIMAEHCYADCHLC